MEQGEGVVVLGFARRDLGVSYWEILSDLTGRGKQIEKVSMKRDDRK